MNPFSDSPSYRCNKTKLLLLSVLLSLLSISIYAQQQPILDQPVSLQLRRATKTEALDALAVAAGVSISYSGSEIDGSTRATYAINGKTLRAAINEILGAALDDLLVSERTITIRIKDTPTRVRGKLTDDQGIAISYATITLDQKISIQTDEDGNFSISMSPGRHHITASSLGYSSKQINYHTAQKTKSLHIVLQPDVAALQSVEIYGQKDQSYRADRSFIGSKVESKLQELPQAVSVVTKELIADQGAVRIGDIIKNLSGVSPFSSYDDMVIRGFRIEGNKNTQLINGMRSFTGYWKQPMVNYLERVEVLKGPSSVLFGNSSPGGVINRVTKKPLDEDRKSLQFSVGSFDAVRAFADFTGPMTKDKTLLYRLNLGYEDAESFRDLLFDKNIVIAPSFSFVPNENTSINFDMLYNDSKSRLDRAQAVFADGDLYSTPISRTMNATNDYLNEKNFTVTASLSHRFSERLSFNASYMKTGYSEDLLEHRSINTYAKDGAGTDLNNMVFRHLWMRKSYRYMDNATAFLNYRLPGKRLAHNLILGYDYAQMKVPLGGSQMTATGYRNSDNTGFIANYDPTKKDLYLLDPQTGNPVPNVPAYDLNDPIKSHEMQDVSKYFFTSSTVQPTFYSLNSLYLQDQLTAGKFKLLLGLRYERYSDLLNYKTLEEDQVRQSVFLPRLGVVYEINQQINAYATYVEGYNPQTASALANPNAGGPFDPLENNMVEVGLKTSWFDHRLDITSSVYKIDQRNTLYPALDSDNPERLEQIGKERSTGFELDVQGRILPNWSIVASYAYNDAQILESANDYDLDVQKPNAPKNSANLWMRYNLSNGLFQGVGVAFGINYVDQRNLRIRSSGKQTIPAYTIANAAIYYKVKKVLIQANLNNITGKTYWVGGYDYVRLFPGAPRNFLLTLGYQF